MFSGTLNIPGARGGFFFLLDRRKTNVRGKKKKPKSLFPLVVPLPDVVLHRKSRVTFNIVLFVPGRTGEEPTPVPSRGHVNRVFISQNCEIPIVSDEI